MKQKTIVVKKDEESGDSFLDLQDFSDIIDISKVVSYELKELKEGALSLVFYDKNKKQIKPRS